MDWRERRSGTAREPQDDPSSGIPGKPCPGRSRRRNWGPEGEVERHGLKTSEVSSRRSRDVSPSEAPGGHVLTNLQEVAIREASGRLRPGSLGLGSLAPPHDRTQVCVGLAGQGRDPTPPRVFQVALRPPSTYLKVQSFKTGHDKYNKPPWTMI